MTIRAIQKTTGVPRAAAVCDECPREEPFACGYENGQPNEGQVKTKAEKQGWSFVKNTTRCPACEPSRRVTPQERRQIVVMLNDVYDDDAQCYSGAETDDSVADVLGVMPGWVAEIRADMFGPAGHNVDMEAIKTEMQCAHTAFAQLIDRLEEAEDQVKAIRSELGAHRSRMDSALAKWGVVQQALSPRVKKAAGVK